MKVSSESINEAEIREKTHAELGLEVNAVRATNESLKAYLEYLKEVNKNIHAISEKYQIMYQTHTQWLDDLQKK